MNIEDIILKIMPVTKVGDPDGCNRERAESALSALEYFARERGLAGPTYEPTETIIRDFLTNLFHLFDYLPAEAFRYSNIAAPIRPTLTKLFSEAQENYQEEVSE